MCYPVSVSSNRILVEEVGILSDSSKKVNVCFLDGTCHQLDDDTKCVESSPKFYSADLFCQS